MNLFYLNSLHRNLQHLHALRPPSKRNLASNASNLSFTDEDPYLSPHIQWSEIADGRQGTQQTLNKMAQIARAHAGSAHMQEFASQFAGVDDVGAWMRNHFTYRDENEEIIRTPLFMLQNGIEGDCDDSSTLIAATTKTMGLPTRFVAIRHDPSNPNFEHVFSQAYEGGRWITIDPTVELGTDIHSLDDMILDV